MAGRLDGETGLRGAIGWLAFPVVPVVLESAFHATLNPLEIDPRDWPLASGLILLGPLVGFGFLAGATLDLPDPPFEGRRTWRAWLLHRRALWVAVGPWSSFLLVAGFVLAWTWLQSGLGINLGGPLLSTPWLIEILLAVASYGWLVVAIAALVRARRQRGLKRALWRGMLAALAFVGSLIGGFWAATETWRSDFFDSRLVKSLLIAAVGLTVTSGCASTPTVGDVRRRELFRAMLMAWVLGLALAWRWWSRAKTK